MSELSQLPCTAEALPGGERADVGPQGRVPALTGYPETRRTGRFQIAGRLAMELIRRACRAKTAAFLGVLVGLCLPAMAHAEWVTVEVDTVVYENNVEAARRVAAELAAEVAMQQAHSTYRNVRLSPSEGQGEASVWQSAVRTGAVKPLGERLEDVWLHMQFRVELLDELACKSAGASRYRKRVAFTRFGMASAQRAAARGQDGTGEILPDLIEDNLAGSEVLQAMNASQYSLYPTAETAPTTEAANRSLTQTVEVARSIGAQFVVSGLVRNQLPVETDIDATSPLGKLMRFTGLSKDKRVFEVEVFINDGFSGALLYRNSYEVSAEWAASATREPTLGEPAFYESEYGKRVAELVHTMTADVEAQVACQPFMTRIRKVDGQSVMFESGALQHIRNGDILQVYRTRELWDGNRFQGTELTEVDLALQVTQVQPDFAFGRFKVNPARFNVQKEDLLIVW